MTKVEARYSFTVPFQDDFTAAIEQLHGVYGMQGLKLSSKADELTVLYDASRLELADVDSKLLAAGLPVQRLRDD